MKRNINENDAIRMVKPRRGDAAQAGVIAPDRIQGNHINHSPESCDILFGGGENPRQKRTALSWVFTHVNSVSPPSGL